MFFAQAESRSGPTSLVVTRLRLFKYGTAVPYGTKTPKFRISRNGSKSILFPGGPCTICSENSHCTKSGVNKFYPNSRTQDISDDFISSPGIHDFASTLKTVHFWSKKLNWIFGERTLSRSTSPPNCHFVFFAFSSLPHFCLIKCANFKQNIWGNGYFFSGCFSGEVEFLNCFLVPQNSLNQKPSYIHNF